MWENSVLLLAAYKVPWLKTPLPYRQTLLYAILRVARKLTDLNNIVVHSVLYFTVFDIETFDRETF